MKAFKEPTKDHGLYSLLIKKLLKIFKRHMYQE